MAGLKKILITPFFGDLPEWFSKFEAPKGYDWLPDTDLESFKHRVRTILGIDYPGTPGSGKIWDYRCALGLLYAKEIEDYDYWGHMDFDVVWGDMDHFLPDLMLSNLDVYSSHHEYVCGCFSLYANTPVVNNLFKNYPFWGAKMVLPEPTGWVEKEYSRTLERSGLRYAYTFNQGDPWDKTPFLYKEGSKLFQDIIDGRTNTIRKQEIMFFHFRHSKRWPL